MLTGSSAWDPGRRAAGETAADLPRSAPEGGPEAKAGTSLLTSATALVAAKIIFVLASYVIYAGLPRLLPAAQFGTFLVVNSTVAVLNAIFVTGTIQAVSRFAAQHLAGAGGTLRNALRLQAILAGSVAALYFLAAPWIAAALNDPALTPYLRISSVIPLAYALYAAMIGYANGMRRFGQQAGFDVSFSATKVTLVLGMAALGYGAAGAVAGFSTAAVAVLVVAWWRIGRPALGSTGEGVPVPTILRFELAVMAHVGFTNLLMQLDLLMVKALSAGDPDTAAALYGAAAKLAQIPYSILVAFNFLIFPYIARSAARAPAHETAEYIRQALRLGIALVAGPAVVLGVVSPGAVSLVFGGDYAAAGPVLQILAGGYVAYALLTMAATIINGAGRPSVSLGITAGAVLMQVVLARALIPAHGIAGGAVASSAAYLLGLMMGGAYLVWRFGHVVPLMSLLRVAAACGAVAGVAQMLPAGSPVVLTAPMLGVMYLLILLALREWSADDLRAVARRSPGGA